MALFGYRVAAEVIKMRSYWSRVGPYPNITGVFIRRRNWNTDSEGRAPCKNEAGGCSYATTSQGTPRAISSWKRQVRKNPLLEARGSTILPTGSQNSGSQNYKTISSAVSYLVCGRVDS